MSRIVRRRMLLALFAAVPLFGMHASVAQNVKSADEIACALTGRAASDCDGTRGITVGPRPPSGDHSPATVSLELPFEINSDRLRPDASAQLDELAAALANPALSSSRIEIIGHTDSSGAAEYNLRLSQKRAEAVRRYLATDKGIDPDRLAPLGLGENEPVPGLSPTASQNRRVEIRLVGGRSP